MTSMKASPWERYGSWIQFLIVLAAALWFVTSELHLSPLFQPFFPLYWLSLTFFAGPLENFMLAFDATSWWIWFEILSTVVGWILVYFMLRGMRYKISSMEGPSMWVMFGIFILFAVLFCMFLLKPAFTQIAIWWTAWPTATSPRLP